MRATLTTSHPLVSSLPAGTVQAAAGGVGPRNRERHPWSSWDVMREVVAAKVLAVMAASSKEDGGANLNLGEPSEAAPPIAL